MIRAGALIGFVALASAIAPTWSAKAQPSASCQQAPAIAPEPSPPKPPPRQANLTIAIAGYEAWAKPHAAYAVCQREQIAQLGKRINALGAQINALVDDAAAIDERVRAAREQRNGAYRAFAERRNRSPDDLPVAPRVTRAAMASPCAVSAVTAAPAFPDGTRASANQMRKADEALNKWAAPLDAFVACRRAERAALVGEHEKLRGELTASQAEFATYRAAYNSAVRRFERSVETYRERLKKPR